MNEEYLPPVVTKLKADLSDFLAGIAEARAVMKAFVNDVKADMLDVSRSAGSMSGMVMVTEMRKVIKQEMGGLGDDIDSAFPENIVPKFTEGGAKAGLGLIEGLKGVLMPLLIGAIVLASPGIAAAIAGIIQLGFGLGIIGLGAFMLRNEPQLIAAATRTRDRIAAVFRNAAAPMLGPFVRALDIIAATFERIAPSIERSFAALAPAIEPLAIGIAGMIESMSPGLTNMLVAAGPIIMEFAKQLPGIGLALGEFFQMIADNAPTIGAFIQDMGRIIPAIVRGLTGMLDFLMGIYQRVHDIAKAMRDAGWETPFHGFVTTGKSVWSWMQETGPKISTWFSDLGDDIADWADETSADIGQWVDDVSAWFATLPDKAALGLQALPGVLSSAVQTAFDGALYYSSLGATRLVSSLINLPGQIKVIFSALWTEAAQMAQLGVLTVVGIVLDLPGQLGAIFARVWQNTTATFFDLKTQVITITGQAIIGIRDWFAQLPGHISVYLNMMKERALNVFRDASNWLYQAGKDLIRGLARGVEDSIDWAVGIVRRGMERIRQGARDALGISSPSKVFAELGRYTMQGYMQGIESERASLARSIGAFGAPAPATASMAGLGLAAAGAGSGNGTLAELPPLLVQLVLDGEVMLEKLIELAQQRKLRTGDTGLS